MVPFRRVYFCQANAKQTASLLLTTMSTLLATVLRQFLGKRQTSQLHLSLPSHEGSHVDLHILEVDLDVLDLAIEVILEVFNLTS